MEHLLDRIQELERRTQGMERRLLRWRLAAVVIALGALSLLYLLPAQAQFAAQPVVTGTVTAPLVVKGTNGQTIFEVKEFIDVNRSNSQDALLTFYRNGQPAAIIRTTGLAYKDVYDKSENFLNVLETWLYRYHDDQQKIITPKPYLATSTALTRSGGSLVVFNGEGNPKLTPPFAVRITAKRGVGGEVVLYNPNGDEGKTLQPR